MKRDMDLIRKILFTAENASEPLASETILVENHSPQEVAYHFQLLIEAGFANGQILSDGAGMPVEGVILNLTWAGQEFLDLCKKDTIWEKAKKESMKVAGSLGFDILKMCLLKAIKGEIDA